MLNPNLISKRQILSNKRRTAKLGLISLLTESEINNLALKHFGVYQDNQLIAYECPYSGKLITNNKEIVLEHIIPTSSLGATILFNTIPVSSSVNGLDEKGSLHLLTWFHSSSKYQNCLSTSRIIKILDYIFDGYDIVISNYLKTPNFFNNNLLEEKTSSLKLIKFTNLTNFTKITSNKKTTFKAIDNIYISFLIDLIKELQVQNVNVKKYQTKLNYLLKLNLFQEIDRYLLFQNILKEILKEKFQDKENIELTYMLNIDIKSLSFNMEEYQTKLEIKNELNSRITNLEIILKEKNIDLLSYFQDIKTNLPFLFKKTNDITLLDINNLIKNIKLSHQTKFNYLKQQIENNEVLTLDIKSFASKIKTLRFKKNQKPAFNIVLKPNELKYLSTSSKKRAQELYLEILKKSLKYNIYPKEDLIYTRSNKLYCNQILAYYHELEVFKVDSIKDLDFRLQRYLMNKYNKIIKKSFLVRLVEWQELNKGDIPSASMFASFEEKYLATKMLAYLSYSPKKHSFNNNFSKEELKYLATSKEQVLNWLYYELYQKAKQYNYPLKIDILPKRLQRPKKKHLIFQEFIDWFLTNQDKLPSEYSKSKTERKIATFYQNIRKICKRETNSFSIPLNREELKTLANSNDLRLLRCYKNIYDKAHIYNIYMEYQEIPKKVASISSLKFKKMFTWIKDKDKTPSIISKDKRELEIGKIFQAIKTLDGHGKNYFQMNLLKEELELLATSTNDIFKNLYQIILFKSLKLNIYSKKDIVYTLENENLYYYYKSYYEDIKKYGNINFRELDVNIQIEIMNKYPNLVSKTSFLKLLDWLKDNEGTPYKERCKVKKIEDSKIGSFWFRIKNVLESSNRKFRFKTMLSKEELKYMALSDDIRLKTCFQRIVQKAIKKKIVINYYPDSLLQKLKREDKEYYSLINKKKLVQK